MNEYNVPTASDPELHGYELMVDEAAELARMVCDRLNPPDDDSGFGFLVKMSVEAAVSYVEAQPRTCSPGDDADPCDRCEVLGRWHDERIER